MTHVQALEIAKAGAEIVGAIGTLCTVVGAPFAKWGSGKWGSFGHLLISFGADVFKARKRFGALTEKEEVLP